MPYELPPDPSTARRTRFTRWVTFGFAALLVAAVAYFAYVGYEGSQQLTDAPSPSTDCRTPAEHRSRRPSTDRAPTEHRPSAGPVPTEHRSHACRTRPAPTEHRARLREVRRRPGHMIEPLWCALAR